MSWVRILGTEFNLKSSMNITQLSTKYSQSEVKFIFVLMSCLLYTRLKFFVLSSGTFSPESLIYEPI